MKIVRVSVNEHRRGVPVKGWNSVEAAMQCFARGDFCGARSAEVQTMRDIGKAAEVRGTDGGMALGYFLLGSALVGNHRSALVDGLLRDAKAGLNGKNSQWKRDYDYDGMGTPFFKAGVDISILDRREEMYLIGIYAAYVGDEPEQGLAQGLGIPRALISCGVEVETTSSPGKRFEFDFEEVLRKLDAVLKTHNIAGTTVAQAMMVTDKHGESRPRCVLQNEDGIEIAIGPCHVGSRINYTGPGIFEDTWSLAGSTLSGGLARDYSKHDMDAKLAPTFQIVVSASEKWDLGYSQVVMPVWHPKRQQQMIDVAKKIAQALR